jgi:hypothetical protein
VLHKIKKILGKIIWELLGNTGATNFPTSLDSYSTKSAGDTIAEGHINDVQDAVEALEAKVGIDSSAVTTSHDYKFNNSARMVQVVNTQTGAVNTGTTQMTADDSIPQNNEGDEYITLAITPTSATNKLKIDIVIHLAHTNGSTLTAALFQDSTANALAAATTYTGYANKMFQIQFTYYMAAGTTSSTTFKIRAGSDSVGTTTFNGSAGSRVYGGVMSSSITITEIKV